MEQNLSIKKKKNIQGYRWWDNLKWSLLSILGSTYVHYIFIDTDNFD